MGNAVEHGFHHHYRLPLASQAQGAAGIGLAQGAHRGILHQLDAGPVVVAQNLHGAVALEGQLLAAPLGQAVTFGCGAVAELGGQGLHKARPADIVVENLIHHLADILKNIPPPDKLLVIGRGGGDLKIIAPAGVKLGIHPVEGKGNDSQYVGLNGRGLPGGIDLAGGHIFDILRKGDGDVFRRLVGQTQMDRNGAGNIGGHRNCHGPPHKFCPGISRKSFWIRLDCPWLRGSSSML